MNAKKIAAGAITAITHQNSIVEMALLYHDVFITAAKSVDKGIIDGEENQSWETQKIHAVPLIWYMRKGAEGLQQMQKEFEAENEVIVNPTHVQWLAHPCTIRVGRQNGENSASSVVFVVMGSKVAQNLFKKGIEAAGVWYRVKAYTNLGPDIRCEAFYG
jgi:hypothetical protein